MAKYARFTRRAIPLPRYTFFCLYGRICTLHDEHSRGLGIPFSVLKTDCIVKPMNNPVAKKVYRFSVLMGKMVRLTLVWTTPCPTMPGRCTTKNIVNHKGCHICTADSGCQAQVVACKLRSSISQISFYRNVLPLSWHASATQPLGTITRTWDLVPRLEVFFLWMPWSIFLLVSVRMICYSYFCGEIVL